MKLTKAIEILKLNLKKGKKDMPPDVKDALKLGVEALEAIHKAREYGIIDTSESLPGETPEADSP